MFLHTFILSELLSNSIHTNNGVAHSANHLYIVYTVCMRCILLKRTHTATGVCMWAVRNDRYFLNNRHNISDRIHSDFFVYCLRFTGSVSQIHTEFFYMKCINQNNKSELEGFVWAWEHQL